MRKLLLTIAAIVLPLSVMAQSIFPENPVPMSPGYGADGQGLHSDRPQGLPGNDCVINPVSMQSGFKQVEVTKLVPGDIIAIPATVLFDFDKSFIRPEGITLLRDTVYTKLVESGVVELEVIGHTDSKGTERYNSALGLRRASAVADDLVSLGFPEKGITVGSAGELDPIAPNTNPDGSDNPDGRQLNRRVELRVISVKDREVTETKTVTQGRNPQVFHRLASGNSVACESNGFLGGDEFRYWIFK